MFETWLNLLKNSIYFADFQNYFSVVQIKQNNVYEKFLQLTEINDGIPEGYYLQFPFYIEGSANAHILVSAKENPTPEDSAYEIGMINYNLTTLI